MPAFDPFLLARELGAVASRLEAAERTRRAGGAPADPFRGRLFPGQSTFEQVSSLGETDPLRLPLLRALHRLIDERIQAPFLAFESQLLSGDTHFVDKPFEAEMSLRELRLRTIAHPRSLEIAPSLASPVEGRLGGARAEILDRRAEVARRLGLAHTDALTGPLENPADLPRLAREFLSRTERLAEGFEQRSYASELERGVARDAPEGWPARLTVDSLIGLVGPELFRSVRLGVFSVPARLVPMSFLRGLAHLGEAWFVALARGDLPSVVALDRERLLARREGVVWSLQAAEPSFLRSRLGLTLREADKQQRSLWIAIFVEARRRAARVLLRAAGLAGPDELNRRAPELGVELFEEECSAATLLARLPTDRSTPSDFVALALGLTRQREFVEMAGADYFREARWQERVRDEASLPPRVRVEPSEIEHGLALLESRVAALL